MRRVLLRLSERACRVPAPRMPPNGSVQRVDTPARVIAIETVDGQVRVNAGGLWYQRRN